ncbi:hypothetical protein ERJ70_17230 [Sediminibacillus dalangtanensis]|uniref:Uncharacterized protein n=1 Tax=Sediminibacillus dalangtanensis TaxID=2729421 RepID=A0ABX7VYX6_9BACI|nr:hypothetical protein [Sediminibacillus dalangtanensis]QTN00874.1 hypothetical protein ERJ70_17230 [Sediminibacillus dalangtanensis]
MKLIHTNRLDDQVLQRFFDGSWEAFRGKQNLKENGFLIEVQGEYKAFFALLPMERQVFWLKSLYIKEGVPSSFPWTVLETAMGLAGEKAADSVYIYSHQEALDTLLVLLQFEQAAFPSFAEGHVLPEGNWWKNSPGKEKRKSVSRA